MAQLHSLDCFHSGSFLVSPFAGIFPLHFQKCSVTVLYVHEKKLIWISLKIICVQINRHDSASLVATGLCVAGHFAKKVGG